MKSLEKKIIALCKENGYLKEEVEFCHDNIFKVGNKAYLVCTDEEADNEFYNSVISLFKEFGLDAFTDYVKNELIYDDTYIEMGIFKKLVKEYYQNMAEELASNKDAKFENSLVDFCYDELIINDKCFKKRRFII